MVLSGVTETSTYVGGQVVREDGGMCVCVFDGGCLVFERFGDEKDLQPQSRHHPARYVRYYNTSTSEKKKQ